MIGVKVVIRSDGWWRFACGDVNSEDQSSLTSTTTPLHSNVQTRSCFKREKNVLIYFSGGLLASEHLFFSPFWFHLDLVLHRNSICDRRTDFYRSIKIQDLVPTEEWSIDQFLFKRYLTRGNTEKSFIDRLWLEISAFNLIHVALPNWSNVSNTF